MNRNGQGPENKGPGTGWGLGGCLSDEEMKNREESWNGRTPPGRGMGRAFGGGRGFGRGAGMGRGRGMGFGRGMGWGYGLAAGVSNAADSAILDRLSALEESIKELKK